MTDPADRSGAKRDERVRLRARVAELEREVRRLERSPGTSADTRGGPGPDFDGGLVGIALLSADRTIVEANDRLCRLVGSRSEAIIGTSWTDLTKPDVRQRDDRLLARVLAGEIDTGQLDTSIVRADGTIAHVAAVIRRARASDDAAGALAVQVLDFTEHRETAEQLRVSSGRLSALAQELRTLLDHTRDFVYRHDINGVFNYLSPSIEQITGYSPEEWEKHYTAYLTDNPVNEKVVEFTERTMRTGREGPSYLVEVRHRDGRAIMLEVNERPFFEDGKVAGIIGVARDVTERVKAEADIKRAKEAAEAASRAKSVFLANMSHEVRTPLAAILGAAELMATGRSLTEDEARQRDIILRNGRLLLALLNELLDAARVEAGRFTVHRVDCVFSEIMADVEAAVRPQHRCEDVELSVRYESAVPTHLFADPTRLKQAVINLVNNALKFTKAGRVCLRVGVDATGPSPFLVIVVEDTGIGIPAEALDRVFEMFHQLDATPGAEQSGTGLGLAVAKSIAEQLGGSLSVRSRCGTGSTFTLRIPVGTTRGHLVTLEDKIIPPFMPSDHTGTVPMPELTGEVLLAEDFTDARRLMADALRETGVRVTEVADGQAAVDCARRRHFDLILLDIRMPVMDGRTAASRMRQHGCHSPMIALTASTEPGDRQTLLEAGFDDLWPKPISLESLVERAGSYLATASPGSGVEAAAPAASVLPRSTRLDDAAAGFARSLDHRLLEIREAISGGMTDRAEEELHKLVGAAGIHGFMEISRLAADLLSIAREGTVTRSSRELDALAEAIDAVGPPECRGGSSDA